MKTAKIVFWSTTVIFSVMMMMSATMYLTDEELKNGFSNHLGIPDYLRIELAVAKALGALALLLPIVPKPVKYFAYAGFTINLISAFVAHMALGDPIKDALSPLIFLAILVVSYTYYHKLERAK